MLGGRESGRERGWEGEREVRRDERREGGRGVEGRMYVWREGGREGCVEGWRETYTHMSIHECTLQLLSCTIDALFSVTHLMSDISLCTGNSCCLSARGNNPILSAQTVHVLYKDLIRICGVFAVIIMYVCNCYLFWL